MTTHPQLSLLIDHFDVAVRTPADVARLKQLILQLAVRGRLVPQDPNDEPAAELLKRISASKQALSKGRNGSNHRRAGEINTPYDLPSGWAWARLADVYDVRDGTHDTPKYVPNGVPLVTSKNLRNGVVDFSTAKYISREDHEQITIRSNVEREDILFAMIGSIGNPAIADDTEFSIKNVALFKYYNKHLSCPKYLFQFLKYASDDMRATSGGGVQSFVALNFLRNYLGSVDI